tara:strand:- start:418 stop:717 length:300 start_codon:yes stop_codon:yes gene_type:complete
MSIRLTNKDRMALNELLNHTYSFNLTGGSERTLKGMQFIITAPGRGRTWYTGSGTSIVEAVDAWFERIVSVEGVRLKRANLETLQEAKENAAEIIQFYD